MNHRFVPQAEEAKQTKIELVRERGHYTSIIKYPKPDPRDRVEEEYDEYGHSE